MNTLYGMPVVISPDNCFRYTKLPADVCVPDWYRAEFNEWARGFFTNGTSLAPDGTVYRVGDQLHMNARTFKRVVETLP